MRMWWGSSLASEATPEPLTCGKREGTLTGRTDSGRRKRPVSRFVNKSGQLLTPRCGGRFKTEEHDMTWETYLEEQQLRYQDELLQFLSIPSISALPEHAGDVQRAAQWVAHRLRGAGLEALSPTLLMGGESTRQGRGERVGR